jgi:acyl-CoA reductase-like NAD-dependent aldehyde dehydrogenase
MAASSSIESAARGAKKQCSAGLSSPFPQAAANQRQIVKPTLFTDVKTEMRIAREEIFGLVGAAISFTDENDAILQGNHTDYGLSAAVWTRDVSRAHKVARSLKAGTVWINCFNQLDPPSADSSD